MDGRVEEEGQDLVSMDRITAIRRMWINEFDVWIPGLLEGDARTLSSIVFTTSVQRCVPSVPRLMSSIKTRTQAISLVRSKE